jgi:hypothetical protein
MSDRKQASIQKLVGGITVPIILSAAIAAALLLDQILAVAAVLAGAGLILLIVRAIDHRDDPLRDVGKIVLRDAAPDSAWLQDFRRKRRAHNEREIRTWRKNAWGVWLLIATLFVMLARVVIVEVWSP